MDLQTRKLTFVREFLNIQNENIVDRFEKMLKKEKSRSIEKDFQPMTLDEFYKRIDQSMLDSNNDKLTNNDELIKEIEGWG
ncbi:MAG TPA: hypothetical protein DCR40_08155 [Prolixibacteraceae bacterium]|nr:hypothetical protein [Prolixibacteraceae bacterium]